MISYLSIKARNLLLIAGTSVLVFVLHFVLAPFEMYVTLISEVLKFVFVYLKVFKKRKLSEDEETGDKIVGTFILGSMILFFSKYITISNYDKCIVVICRNVSTNLYISIYRKISNRNKSKSKEEEDMLIIEQFLLATFFLLASGFFSFVYFDCADTSFLSLIYQIISSVCFCITTFCFSPRLRLHMLAMGCLTLMVYSYTGWPLKIIPCKHELRNQTTHNVGNNSSSSTNWTNGNYNESFTNDESNSSNFFTSDDRKTGGDPFDSETIWNLFNRRTQTPNERIPIHVSIIFPWLDYISYWDYFGIFQIYSFLMMILEPFRVIGVMYHVHCNIYTGFAIITGFVVMIASAFRALISGNFFQYCRECVSKPKVSLKTPVSDPQVSNVSIDELNESLRQMNRNNRQTLEQLQVSNETQQLILKQQMQFNQQQHTILSRAERMMYHNHPPARSDFTSHSPTAPSWNQGKQSEIFVAEVVDTSHQVSSVPDSHITTPEKWVPVEKPNERKRKADMAEGLDQRAVEKVVRAVLSNVQQKESSKTKQKKSSKTKQRRSSKQHLTRLANFSQRTSVC